MRNEDLYHATLPPQAPQTPVYWCDACQHCDRLTSGAYAHCNYYDRTIFNPIGCEKFNQIQSINN